MALSRQALFGKLGLTLFKSVESATAFCKLRGNPYVELVHWLHQLWQVSDTDFRHIARHFKLSDEVLERDFARALGQLPAGAGSISDFSHHIELAIERAWIYATLEFSASRIRSGHLLAALLATSDLRRVLLAISPGFQAISVEQLVETLPAITLGSIETGEIAFDQSKLDQVMPGEASGALAPHETGSRLALYCSDLTALARDGGIDPVVGRGHEIRTIIDILLRRRQNNPLLTGDAGVGKTAVVEGLALAIAQGEVPPALAEVRLLALDIGALLAGASMKGEFESRLKGVLDEASSSVRPVILFIDEIHTLIGAGGNAGTGDAANLLKPALARGALRTIGATTWSEYKRHIEKDAALTRRFQVLQVSEPEEDAAVSMLRGLVAMLEKHHGVWITDDAVRAAVRLSHRYIQARQLPDKAISLLDTACARVAVSLQSPPAELQLARATLTALETERDLLDKARRIGRGDIPLFEKLAERIAQVTDEVVTLDTRWKEQRVLADSLIEARRVAIETDPDDANQAVRDESLQRIERQFSAAQRPQALVQVEVSEAVVAAIVADWTGIPAGRMLKDEINAVLELPAHLARRVIGQPAALEVIGERIIASRANLGDPGKPVAVFMLVGPSGVGKTETALALADALYGGEQNLITVNMSEYQEAHSVSSLKGAPPGYVGYGEGGVLTEAVRRRPYSVVLLDEIEKAHRDVHEVFYQVFDKGWMEDGEGRRIDFRNTVLLLTSNVGADLVSSLCDDAALIPEPAALRDALQPALLDVFPAAFMGRVCVVPYQSLGAATVGEIVKLQLDRIGARMKAHHGVEFTYGEDVIAHIVERCPIAETGARMLIGFIDQQILPGLSRYWLVAQDQDAAGAHPQCITLSVANNAFVYRSSRETRFRGGLQSAVEAEPKTRNKEGGFFELTEST